MVAKTLFILFLFHMSVPISYHFLRLYSATGRACRRKWRYIKYTPLPLPLPLHVRTA